MNEEQFLGYLKEEFGKKRNEKEFEKYSGDLLMLYKKIYEEYLKGPYKTTDQVEEKYKDEISSLKNNIKIYGDTGLFSHVSFFDLIASMKLSIKGPYAAYSKKKEDELIKEKENLESYLTKFSKAKQLFEEYQKESGSNEKINEALLSIDGLLKNYGQTIEALKKDNEDLKKKNEQEAKKIIEEKNKDSDIQKILAMYNTFKPLNFRHFR